MGGVGAASILGDRQTSWPAKQPGDLGGEVLVHAHRELARMVRVDLGRNLGGREAHDDTGTELLRRGSGPHDDVVERYVAKADEVAATA